MCHTPVDRNIKHPSCGIRRYGDSCRFRRSNHYQIQKTGSSDLVDRVAIALRKWHIGVISLRVVADSITCKTERTGHA
ncbi:hypothetical protein GQ600_22474 [Phytophthora cactorum]|nr:hypothetical protein GQ600_22474 [Phytophthora cactorum]